MAALPEGGDGPVQVEFPDEKVIGVERGEGKDADAGLGQRHDQRRQDADERQVKRADDSLREHLAGRRD
jgi:hypothetical protein